MIKKIFISIAVVMQLQGADVTNKELLKCKLAEMVAEDQSLMASAHFAKPAVKEKFIAAFRKQSAKHVDFLKKVLSNHDWITVAEFGSVADQDAWLLVQHADHDRAFQKEVLARLKRLYPLGQTAACNYAFLYDRIAVAEKRLQLYGTLGEVVEGKWKAFPIDDPDRLDERRKVMGMVSMQEYIAVVQESMWVEGSKPKKAAC